MYVSRRTSLRRSLYAFSLIAISCLLSGTMAAQNCDGLSFYEYSTFAGPSTGLGFANGNGFNASFYEPSGVAVFGGDTYVADALNHVIRKVTVNGDVTTVAGIPGSPGSNDGSKAVARFQQPRGIAINSLGVIYVADYGNHTIRKVDVNGNVSTVAGVAGVGAELDGNTTLARFNGPWGILADDDGNLVVSDALGHTIRVVSSLGEVLTVGGKANTPGHADGAVGTSLFRSPKGIAVDSGLNVWVADSGNHVLRVIVVGAASVATVAGTPGQTGTQNGNGVVALFNNPTSLVATGNQMYVVDRGNYSIRTVGVDTIVNVGLLAGASGVKGYVDAAGTEARFDDPFGIAVDQFGGVLISEVSAGTIRRLGVTNVAATVAGTRRQAGSTDGSGAAVRFDRPSGAVFDTSGNLYVSDRANHTVRKITPAGVVTTVAGTAGLSGTLDGAPGIGRLKEPAGLEIDSQGNLYVADSGNHAIRRIDTQGNLTTYAGTLGTPGSGNASPTASMFRNPEDVAFGQQGVLFVADKGNMTIRSVTASAVTLVAGAAGVSGTTDGPAGSARFRSPSGIDVAADGSVYVADAGAHTIRKISGGLVATVAGSADLSGTAGGLALNARFSSPSGLTVDASGNVFIADRVNMAVRRLSASGYVTTVGGSVAEGSTKAGLGPIARFSEPVDVALNANGEPHVISTGNGVVHKAKKVVPLCLEKGRFALSLAAADPRTSSKGLGLAIPQNDVFGYFAIPDLTNNPGNPEVFAKLLDGRGFNNNFWVFYGGLTDFEFDLVVTDVIGGSTKVYHKDGGSFCGGADTAAFSGGGPASIIPSELITLMATEVDVPAMRSSPEQGCTSASLCLFTNRFAISLSAKDPRTQVTGAGLPIPQTDLFGYFSIPDLTSNPSNPEVFVKLLDGRGVNGKFWVFYGGLTDFEFTLTVVDTVATTTKQYKKDGGSFCGGADTSAF